jgi:hypothetical protein
MTTLEAGRMSTCRFPPFSALQMERRQSANTDMRTGEKEGVTNQPKKTPLGVGRAQTTHTRYYTLHMASGIPTNPTTLQTQAHDNSPCNRGAVQPRGWFGGTHFFLLVV